MKVAVALLLLIGLCATLSVNASPRPYKRKLHDDLDDFIALVPKDEVLSIFLQYVANDDQVQNVIEYVQTSEFRELVRAVESIPDVVSFYEYLHESGLDVYYLVNKLHDFIGLPPLVPQEATIRMTGGVAGLIADIKGVLPIDDIKALYHKKLETSAEFQELIERLQSPKFQAVVDTLLSNSEFQEILKRAKEVGIDLEAITDLLSTIFGLEFPHHEIIRIPRALSDDLDDFVALVPQDKVLNIFLEYVTHDEQVQYAVEYSQSSEFQELVKAMESISDVIHFYDYLQESGLDVYYLVNKLHEFIGLPPLIPQRATIRIAGGVAGLIADIKAVLPIDDIKTLYHEKLETSAEFKELVERLHSSKFQAVVDALLANPEFQEIIKKAKEVGIDLEAITDLLSTIFGLEFPHHKIMRVSRTLSEDLDDFVALVPQDKVLNIFLEYVTHDEQVQYAVEYSQSSEFQELVKAMESISDVIHFYDYLQESGLDVYYLVNKLHEFIGLPPLIPQRATIRITGGVAGLIADIKAVLPIDDIKALYHKKLKTSAEFKELVERLHSPKFQAVVDALLANPEFQEIVKKAKEVGIDLEAITDILSTIFGLNFPHHKIMRVSRTLSEDLDDFVALVPQDKVLNIFLEYVTHDEQVQYAVEYSQSSEFRELVKAMESISDVIHFYDYLQESGLDVYYLVNKLHEFIGLPPLIPQRATIRIAGGVAGLIADIKAVLPIDDIKALYHEKLKTSVEFKELVERLHSPKFQAVVDALLANPVFQAIVEKAKEVGIDLVAITDLLSTIFGLNFPSSNGYIRAPYVSFNDFIDLLPLDAIKKILRHYSENDIEIINLNKYVQTAEFAMIAHFIDHIPSVRYMYQYLDEAGFDVHRYVSELHSYLNVPDAQQRQSIGTQGGLRSLFKDIQSVLPIDELITLHKERMQTDPVYNNYITQIHSQKFKNIVEDVIENQEFKIAAEKLQAGGFDVAAILDLVQYILYFHESQLLAPSFNDDMQDFVALIPIKKVAEITVKYVLNDEEVQEAVRYIRSEELRKLALKLQEDPEVYEFLKYFEDSGADIINIINILNEFLDIPPYPGSKNLMKNESVNGGVQGMLNEIRAVLPYDEIEAMYKSKMENSSDFRYFIERIEDPAFQKIVDKIVFNKNVLELGHQAELHGINIETIAKFLTEIFGLQLPDPPYFPSNSHSIKQRNNLADDFDDFYHLLPVDQISELAVQYLLHDKEIQETFKYMRSEEFKSIIRAIHAIPEYKQLLNELEIAGVNINSVISEFHHFIGFEGILRSSETGSTFQTAIEKPGLTGFIESIKEMLPYKEIKTLYEKKMVESESFARFITFIKSQTFQSLVNKLFENKNFQALLHEAKDHGVNLQAISDFFLHVFGITTPPGIINHYH